MRWLARTLAGSIVWLVLSVPILQGQTSPVRYVYDEIGRLVGVIDPSGDAAVYTYDAVGNLLSISRDSSGTVSIIEFTPNAGPIGAVVTISGIGFSSTPASNSVTFNGQAATVSAATTTQLTVTVPSGATTGAIAVTSPSGSDTSASAFTVTTSGAPTITSFSPGIGTPGTSVSISGTNFETAIASNRIKLNLTPAFALAGSTTTTLSTTVPAATGSGRIKVETPFGAALSADDLFVPPSPYAASDVQYTNRMGYGDSRSVSITTSGKIGLVVFDAAAGQRSSVKAVPGPNSTVKVHGTSGTSLVSRGTGAFTILLEPGYLPLAGTYMVSVDPSSTGTGTVTITLYHVPDDVGGTFTPASTGDPETVTMSTPGQNARPTFSGTAGQRIAIKVNGGGPTGTVSLLAPNNSALGSVNPGFFNSFLEPVTLGTTGTHTVLADPLEEKTGSYTLTVYDVPADLTGSLTINGGSTPVSLTPGQNASYTFSGTQNDQVTVRVTSNTIGGANIKVLKPDGTQLTQADANFQTLNLPATLPVTGTYTIRVNPPFEKSGSLNLAVTLP
jgi:YD repeat-containing protein